MGEAQAGPALRGSSVTPLDLIREAARESREREAKATPGPWFTVDLPWRSRDVPTYVVAGNPDPHVGTPVLDSIDVDEWMEGEDPEEQIAQADENLAFAARARTELGQWREAALMLAERLYERGGGDALLAAVAEKLKGGRG